jgi:hypothetical protein
VCNSIISESVLYKSYKRTSTYTSSVATNVGLLHVGNLMTISRRLHISASARPTLSTALLQQDTPQKHAQPQQILKPQARPHIQPPSDSSPDIQQENRDLSKRTRTLQHVTSGLRRLLSLHTAPELELRLKDVTPSRYLTPSNQLVGGVFLHHTRRKPVVSCAHYFPQKLAHACDYSYATETFIRSACSRMLDSETMS